MPSNLNNLLPLSVLLFIIAGLGLQALISSRRLPSYLRKYLYLPARKSKTNAIVLGGLPLAITFLIATILIKDLVSLDARLSLLVLVLQVSIFFVGIFGYLDDLLELPPKFKLTGQLIPLILFFLSGLYFFNLPAIVIFTPILIFWGFGVMNGANLIDGIDTITIKVSTVIYFSFFAIAYLFNIYLVQTFALVFCIPLFAFYFFNRQPAKIHLGEIGCNLLGVSYVFLSLVLFLGLSEELPLEQSLPLALFPLTIPMVELGISCLRRIYFLQSPFRSDQLHMHHIFSIHKKISPGRSATYIATIYFILALSAILIIKLHPLIMTLTYIISSVLVYPFICFEYWKKDVELERREKNLLLRESLKNKNVKIINSSLLDGLDYHINKLR